MEPFPVVEQLDVPENGLPHVFDVHAHGVAHRLLVAQVKYHGKVHSA